MRETAKNILTSPFTQLIVYALVIGVAWGTIKMEVKEKVDKKELSDAVFLLQAKDASQMVKIEEMANDIKVIRAILCSKENADSFCRLR